MDSTKFNPPGHLKCHYIALWLLYKNADEESFEESPCKVSEKQDAKLIC